MVGGVDDVGVVELAHLFQPLEHAADLDVDVLATGILTADLVADARRIPPLPDSADRDFIPDVQIPILEGMRGQIVQRQAVAWRAVPGATAGRCGSVAPYFASNSGVPSRVSCGCENP